jgi:hypothetical protein
MALDAYIAQVQSLLNDPGAVEYTTANLTIYINDARVQIAGASEAIRFLATLTLANATQSYPFTSIGGLPTGAQGVLAVRKMNVNGGGTAGVTEVFGREWDWFFSYCLCGPIVGTTGIPNTYSQLPPGVASTLYLSPTPNAALPSVLDVVGYPIPLETDATVELLPYPWTEAVQYYAAYLAYMNAQRFSDADGMLQRYDLFQTRATQMTTPTALPGQAPGYGGAVRAGAARPITAPPPGQGGR